MVKVKKLRKLKVQICPLKSSIVTSILSKKERRLSVLPKPFPSLAKKSLKKNKLVRLKINLQTASKSHIKRWFLKRNLFSIKKVKETRIRLSYRKKLYKRFKKVFGNKRYNKKKLKLPVESANSLFYFKLTIIIKKNNIFCNFSDFKKNKTLNSCSSGKYKIKVSKKTLKYTHDLVLNKFYKEI